MKLLFPLTRSLANEDFNSSCEHVLRNQAFQKKKISSGTKVYDWVVPKRWTLVYGLVRNRFGEVIIDSKVNNLHVINGSTSFVGVLNEEEFLQHLHFREDLPDAIPYVTSYYGENWGFCVQYNSFKSLNFKGPFYIELKTEFEDSELNWYEVDIVGSSDKWFLVSTYACHPSLANDNLSGLVLTGLLADRVARFSKKRFNYKIIIIPETIGSLVFMHENQKNQNFFGGFVVTTNGGPGKLGFKKTYLENHWLDLFAEKSIRELESEIEIHRFAPDGSDERQFSGPYSRIPMITVTKSKYHEYLEYHTSLDNLDFISPTNILKSLNAYDKILNELENDFWPQRTQKTPGEFQLGKHNLYPKIGGKLNTKSPGAEEAVESYSILDAYMWVMFYSDGHTPLKFIADRSGINLSLLRRACFDLASKGLITL